FAPAAPGETEPEVAEQGEVAPEPAGETYDVILVDDPRLSVPVGEVAGPNCVLLLWTPHTRLPDALDRIRAWGFVYGRSLFLREPKRRWGSRGLADVVNEQCLVAVRKGAKGRFDLPRDNLV